MTRTRLLVPLVLLAPQVASADIFDRYETAHETLNANIMAFYLSRLPEVEGKIPPTEWDEVDREIGRCVLNTMQTEGDGDKIEGFVASTEALAAIELTSFEVFSQTLMAPMDPTGGRAAMICGQTDRAMMLAIESGLLEFLSDTANQARLQAD